MGFWRRHTVLTIHIFAFSLGMGICNHGIYGISQCKYLILLLLGGCLVLWLLLPQSDRFDQNDAWFWVILNFRLHTVTNPRSEVLVGSLGSCPISPRLMQWVGCVGVGLADGGRFGVQLYEERQRLN